MGNEDRLHGAVAILRPQPGEIVVFKVPEGDYDSAIDAVHKVMERFPNNVCFITHGDVKLLECFKCKCQQETKEIPLQWVPLSATTQLELASDSPAVVEAR